jgi:polyphosphate kinase
VVRQEIDGIRRYCHLSTGNYNDRTAGIYSDVGIFTSRESFGEDLTELFNFLTGYARPQKFHHLAVAPIGLREHFLELIQNEIDHARACRAARIIAKVNSLIDEAIIEQLYRASEAGVVIDLIVRGMCSLRPGVPGVSENIRVVSIVDRYLEHARVFYFHNAGEPSFWLASADWMPRNFNRRIEIAIPVIDPSLQNRLKEILDLQLADTVKGWRMQADGSYLRKPSGKEPIRFQENYYEKLQSEAHSGACNSMALASAADSMAPESDA